MFFFFSSRRRHTRLQGDWSSDVCSSDLDQVDGVQRRDDLEPRTQGVSGRRGRERDDVTDSPTVVEEAADGGSEVTVRQRLAEALLELRPQREHLRTHRVFLRIERLPRDEPKERWYAGSESGLRDGEELFRVNPRRPVCRRHRYAASAGRAHFCGPAHWLMRKITNSAGRTIATPISVITWPRSRTSGGLDRKSTRLNSSHLVISYAVFCLKKKKKKKNQRQTTHHSHD